MDGLINTAIVINDLQAVFINPSISSASEDASKTLRGIIINDFPSAF